ncbi:zinc finger protein 260-like isoform X2 [Calliphora vicina]|uniref:zinc finger protein 260-like isoform X2 n=1 Tax=Calliphora vicina TaxID=7373 RepID=UPI00325A618F
MKQRCRCCLITNSNAYYDIFEHHKSGTTYAENIRFLAEVQIDHDDGLPQQICSNCYDEVQRIYDFGLNVRLADEKLRQELEATKNQIEDEDQMENVQVLENEYFAPVDDNGMQVCVMEEILEHETEQENVLIVEEIHDVEEINMVEDMIDLAKDLQTKSYNQKENLLVGLAQVAATQENVNINDNQSADEDAYFPEDENDEDYLIEFDANEVNNFVPSKWKCGECKVILRGDVSYEGHMNIHRQIRPHKCVQCQTEYRCRTALKRHKEFRHSLPIQNTTKKTYICMDCNNNFYSENIFYLHQAIVHDQGDKCPFQCDTANVNNIKEHIESLHPKELNTLALDDTTTYQCFRCSKTFENISLLECHAKTCERMYDEPQLHDDNLVMENRNIIEIIKVEGGTSDISVNCNICRKKLLKKNLNKHLELHKRKEEENKVVDDTKPYLCSFCPSLFETKDDLDDHYSTECYIHISRISKFTCTQCNKNFTHLKHLEEHEEKVHSRKYGYICYECGNSFGGRVQLSAHKRLHKERPFKCDQCDKAYPRKVELVIHMRSHTGELPYACHLCDKRFAIKVRLTYHLQKHEGVTHACTYCSAVYDNRNKLKAHLFKHTGMPYKCEFCPELGFERRIRFANHMKRVHQKTLSEEELTQIFAKNTGKTVHFKNPEKGM